MAGTNFVLNFNSSFIHCNFLKSPPPLQIWLTQVGMNMTGSIDWVT